MFLKPFAVQLHLVRVAFFFCTFKIVFINSRWWVRMKYLINIIFYIWKIPFNLFVFASPCDHNAILSLKSWSETLKGLRVIPHLHLPHLADVLIQSTFCTSKNMQMFLKCQLQEAFSGKVDDCGRVKCHSVTISKSITDRTECIHLHKKGKKKVNLFKND